MNYTKDRYERTPLHYIIQSSSKEIIELLIKNGADINARDTYGATPIHYVLQSTSKEIVEILIKNGADVNAKDTFGATPLSYILKSSSKEIVEILIKNGVDVNVKNKIGQTPLDAYLEHLNRFPNRIKDKVEKIKILLAQGAKTQNPEEVKAILQNATPSSR